MMQGSNDRRPRIVDVARHAGVSAQTVSNVINGRGGFTEPTRLKVEAAIAELGFKPNRYAQSLRSRRTGLIGFEMSRAQLDVTNPFTVSFLATLIRAADRRGQGVLVFTHDHGSADTFRTTVQSGLVDGFVLSDAPAGDARASVLTEEGVPFVVMGRTTPDQPQTWVDVDNHLAMRAPVDHLVERGCTRFAMVAHGSPDHWDRDRVAGTRAALRAHGIRLPARNVILGGADGVRRKLPRLLASPDRPDAIITASDSLAVAVLGTVAAAGLRVGADVAVTGFDGGPLCTMVSPELTSVEVPVDHIAEVLVERLVAQINGEDPWQEGGLIVPTGLVVRDSSLRPRAA